jgi:adenine-specific DNA methylase
MSDRPRYPKRLIEVDLPIKRISAHARREKSIRHGHISTLHIWWARRPLAACRAVICAALWPDPADPDCPAAFRDQAIKEMLVWSSHERQQLLSEDSRKRFEVARQKPTLFEVGEQLRGALLDFIADFANWDNSNRLEFVDTSRALTRAAHEALTGAPDTWPLVMDPFAGGGSIPLEALRVGANVFASDLNPVPVLLNKVVLEYIPKYGERLVNEVRKWGDWIKREASKELAEFYPNDADDTKPIAYLWARTVRCEGPGCGAEVPLIRSLWLAKKSDHSLALQLVPRSTAKLVDFRIIVKSHDGWVDQADPKKIIADPKFDGTVARGSATCPCCGFTMPVTSVRSQLSAKSGGAAGARLFCVISAPTDSIGRKYRTPTSADLKAAEKCKQAIMELHLENYGGLSLIPSERFTGLEPRRIPLPQYGIHGFADLFTPRQLLTMVTLSRIVRRIGEELRLQGDLDFAAAVSTCLAFAVDRQADYLTSLTVWASSGEFIAHTFGRQALPIVWEWAECQPFSNGAGTWEGGIGWILRVLDGLTPTITKSGEVAQASADSHPLPDDCVDAVITDPPYYYSIPYADLSDFFYVWLRRMLCDFYPTIFDSELTPKGNEIIQNLPHSAVAHLQKDRHFYEERMRRALSECHRTAKPQGIAVVVFAHTQTDAWEALLTALIGSGWRVTASWPIDTERSARVLASRQSTLASSIHLVCRPRENLDGSITEEIGDWRDVLAELPLRIHEWMPRLAEEGVVGADAIFACIGPALEIFSRYSSVEKASGEVVILKEYLEQVWAAVAREALTMIFTGADASGFEEDARLTAMWLWTLRTDDINGTEPPENEEEEDEESAAKKVRPSGFVLEFDAARKIAQGLGAHLEDLSSIVKVSGETARLLPVAERAAHLFGKDEGKATPVRKQKKPQLDLFKGPQLAEETAPTFGETEVSRVGDTVLDRIHQSMILFAAGRSEALKRFLVEDGAGTDQRFWKLAQALSALYAGNTDEKRWVDGVLARKKGLGL